jgi:DNA polymerase V
LPFYLGPAYLGFPSPASDYLEGPINLNEHLISNPAATFLLRAKGDSMVGACIADGAVLIVDRSIQVVHNDIVVAAIDGDIVCKRIKFKPSPCLISEHADYPPIIIVGDEGIDIIGKVTAVINQFV